MNPKIFISHSHQDNRFVEKLAEDIEDSGIACWLDLWELQLGDSLRAKIETGISSSNWLIVVLSKDSIQSKWVQQEINMGFVKELETRDVFILPVVRDDCEVPLSLKDKYFADFRHEYSHGLETVISKLKYSDEKQRLKFRKLKRLCKKFDEQLPIFCDLFVICIKSGLPIIQIFEILSTELDEPIKTELNQAIREIEDGGSLRDSFKKTLDKYPTKRMSYVYLASSIGEQTGSLDETLINARIVDIEPGKII